MAVCESCAGPRGQVWFAAVNFVGDEAYHPLDFFSNKMRTRPRFFVLPSGFKHSGQHVDSPFDAS